MSKRSKTESPSKAKPKRAKTAPDQSLIHQFFTSPRAPNSGRGSGTLGSPGTSRISQEKAAPSTPAVIDIDAFDDAAIHLANTSSELTTSPVTPVDAKCTTSIYEYPVYDDLTSNPVIQGVGCKPWLTASVPYSFLAHALSSLTQTRSRITISNILTNCMCMIIRYDPPSLIPAIYLLSNTLTPPYSSLELGLGPSIISRSIQHVSGLTSSALKRLYNSMGDAGDVAFAAKSNLRTLLPHPPLLVNFVYTSLLKIARCKGQGTAREREKIVEKLLLAAKGEEIRFLTRTMSQNLRVGAVRTTILAALSHAMVLTPITHFTNDYPEYSLHASAELLDARKDISSGQRKPGDIEQDELVMRFAQADRLIRRIYVQHPNYEDIISALLQAGLDGLEERVQLMVGIPLHPTLGSPTRSLHEVYEICQNRPFIAEFKYDGQRAQIHGVKEGENISVTLFSRHLENMTTKYPDVVDLFKNFFNDHTETTSFILDAEIVAIDPDGGLKSFQDLSRRARKDVQLQDVRILVSVFAFDLMYLNGEVLLERTLRERRELLITRFPAFVSPDKQSARLNHVESCASTEGRNVVETFWEKAIESCCEGLMIKLLDNQPMTGHDTTVKLRRKELPATYEPDKRTSAWLKLKKDYVVGLGDTLDLVPIGAWHGNGRKAQWWSPILLGVWQPDSGRIVAVCKCMSGFTDAFYKELAGRYRLSEDSDTCSQHPLWECDTGDLTPDVYFKPLEVWEICGADITLSPVSIAAKGIISANRGLSLRFPRFIKVREDKSIENASTPEFLAKLWRSQETKGQEHVDDGELVDVEFDSICESSSDSASSQR